MIIIKHTEAWIQTSISYLNSGDKTHVVYALSLSKGENTVTRKNVLSLK